MAHTPEMTITELAELRTAGAPHLILDVREADELRTVAIPGAIHIAMQTIPERYNELPTDVKLIVMCHHGGRSARVTAFLQQNGYKNAINLVGGIDAWAQDLDPTLARY